jgi:hypothetical protein
MYTPYSTEDIEGNALPEWREPFLEPMTFPLGWDLSGNPADLTPAVAEEDGPNDEN